MPTREHAAAAAAPARPARRCGRSFFATDAVTLARALLGCTLVRTLEDGTPLAGTIVEVEAYLGAPDRASHARGGRRTPRNEAMYAQPGTAYVYFTYGMHYCFNAVGGAVDVPEAVLIRALEPVKGLERMRAHRRAGAKAPASIPDRDLCRGPGRLCQALGIARAQCGLDMVTSDSLWIERPPRPPRAAIARSPRIGVAAAGARWSKRRLRFFLGDCRYVSGPTGR